MNACLRNQILTLVNLRFPQAKIGRPSANKEYILERICHVLYTGCQWRRLHTEGISPMTVYHHFNIWSKARIFQDAFYIASNIKNASLEREQIIVDTTFVKNIFGISTLGRNPTDRGRKATKVCLFTDSSGTPLASTFHPANRNDSSLLPHALNELFRKQANATAFTHVHSDKGFDSKTCRTAIQMHGMEPRITKRGMQDSGKVRYVVEQTFGLLDKFRRLILRYDTCIRNFKSFWFLGCHWILSRR